MPARPTPPSGDRDERHTFIFRIHYIYVFIYKYISRRAARPPGREGAPQAKQISSDKWPRGRRNDDRAAFRALLAFCALLAFRALLASAPRDAGGPFCAPGVSGPKAGNRKDKRIFCALAAHNNAVMARRTALAGGRAERSEKVKNFFIFFRKYLTIPPDGAITLANKGKEC